MKIIQHLFSLLLCFSATSTYAENADSVKLVNLERLLQKEIQARDTLTAALELQATVINQQAQCIDSLKSVTEQNAQNIKTTAEQLGVQIDETNTALGTKASTVEVKTKAIWGGVCLLLLFIIGGVIYYVLHKRINKGNTKIDILKQKAEKLNEDILNQFAHEIGEMQKIASSLAALSQTTANNGNADIDHSLIKVLADRITFMEVTLYRMDPKVKGFKQLSKSIAQMKDNLLANGYELVEMLGKRYNDGMKVVANFIEDEDLAEGTQIITNIIKPQINYKGKMIQAAQITVSQNI